MEALIFDHFTTWRKVVSSNGKKLLPNTAKFPIAPKLEFFFCYKSGPLRPDDAFLAQKIVMILPVATKEIGDFAFGSSGGESDS